MHSLNISISVQNLTFRPTDSVEPYRYVLKVTDLADTPVHTLRHGMLANLYMSTLPIP